MKNLKRPSTDRAFTMCLYGTRGLNWMFGYGCPVENMESVPSFHEVLVPSEIILKEGAWKAGTHNTNICILQRQIRLAGFEEAEALHRSFALPSELFH